MPLTQENRLIAVDTPLGRDVLLLLGFKGREEVSNPFRFELDLISENHNISFESIVGKNVTVSIILADGSKRYFNGIVASFSQGRGGAETGSDPRFSYYTAVMVPWLWLLARYADVKIFQELSTPDIVEKVFTDREFSDFKLQLQGNYEKRTYCVQYRETDFNFISRLLEEEGIYYYFEHEKGKHTLVLADSPSGHKPCPKQDSARYQITAGGHEEEDVITGLDRSKAIRCGKYALNDYNYLMPNTDLRTNVSSRQMLGPGKREIYDYPGLYPNKGRGDHLTTVRMEEEEAQITTITGTSVCRAFTTGYRFTLQDHYRQDMNHKAYVLTGIDHEAYQGADYPGVTGDGGGEESTYSNSFECIPYDVPYRPLCRAEKTRVHGTQTAVVVGPSGEEIYTDDLGRIKVQFHWDREGKKDENSSCWIRVGQLWAGPQWGAMYIPRIGQEVVVDFLEGDPDRPLVIGCVYHKAHMPPLDLTAEKTRSTIKSDSTIGGGGFNEFRFEDKKGQEEIYIHAQRDMKEEVEHDKSTTVKHDETRKVENDHTVTIMNNDSLNVTGKQDIQVTGPVTIQWLGGAQVTIGGSGLTINSPTVTITAGTITLHTPTLIVDGIVQCTNLIASVGVVSPAYSPGVGNII
jgi:type VI secretion system secreted protein VgrG